MLLFCGDSASALEERPWGWGGAEESEVVSLMWVWYLQKSAISSCCFPRGAGSKVPWGLAVPPRPPRRLGCCPGTSCTGCRLGLGVSDGGRGARARPPL